MSLTATERLNRWGAAKKAPSEALKPSIATMRRMGSADLAPVEAVPVNPVDRALASDSIEAAVAAPVVAAPVVDSTPGDLAKTLGAMQAKLDTIGGSVEFTEAYVAAGMTKSVGDMLAKELALAERLGAMRAQYQGRQRFMWLVVIALVALLVAEVQVDFLGAFSGDAIALATQAAETAWSGMVWAFTSLRALLPS